MRFEAAEIPQFEVDRLVHETRLDFLARPGFYINMGFNSAADAANFAREKAREGACWKNDVYTVTTYDAIVPAEGWPPLMHLTIKRNDREPIHDWRDLQEIKNALVGPECEAVELYPAESRRVDTANQYHLFAIAEVGRRWPFGFTVRAVTDDPGLGRAKQRPR